MRASIVDMQDVLARLDRAHGRFVPLDNGRFLALTEDLQRQLRRLEGVSEEAATAAQLSWPRLHGRGRYEWKAPAKCRPTSIGASCRRASGRRIRIRRRFPPRCRQAELRRDYQVEGFAWMSRLANLQMGACLADDMGLGKTVQTIAVMLEQQAHGACLVVAPTSVCHNWEIELARFAPSPQRTPAGRRPQDRAALIEAMGPGDVLIASFAGLL